MGERHLNNQSTNDMRELPLELPVVNSVLDRHESRKIGEGSRQVSKTMISQQSFDSYTHKSPQNPIDSQ